MLKKLFVIPLCALTLTLAGCLDSNDDAPAAETPSSVPSITVTCTTATDATCDAANDGANMYMAWTNELCNGFTGSSIDASNAPSASCSAGSCTATSSGDWLGDSNAVVTIISSTTAVIWLDFTDNGVTNDDGPASGDIFCCAENQSGNASLTDTDCIVIP